MSAISVCVALGVASSACVRPEAPTVGMSKVEANLVFGVTDIPKQVESPVQQALARIVAPDGDVGVEEEQPFEFKKPPVPKFGRAVSTAQKEACPEAPITAAPLVAPQPRISGDPRPGTSKWRAEGYITQDVGGEPTKVEFAIFVPRVIRNFERISEHVFTFEEVQDRELDVVVTTYQVNNAPVTANPSDGVGVVETPGVGEPERGIVLIKEEILNKKTGQPEKTFAPSGVGLLMLPLPATAGEQFASTAVDPRTGETRSHDATVMERQRIDACGDLVDGWGVEYNSRGSQDTRGVGAISNAFEFVNTKVYATQYGGVLIFETFELTGEQCGGPPCPLKYTTKLAQLEPTPPAEK
jgi:hypothetical protein